MVKSLLNCFSHFVREKGADSVGRCGVILILSVTLLTGVLRASPAFSQEVIPDPPSGGTGTFDQGPDGNPFAYPNEIRREIERGEKVDSILSSKFEPLHKLWDPLAEKLDENGLEITFQYTAIIQSTDGLIPGIKDTLPGAENTLFGGDADLFVKWYAYKRGEAWAGYFRLSGEYRHGYSDNLPAAMMGAQIGSLWPTMRGWTVYSCVALTEFYWHQGTLKSPFEYRIGRVKNTTVWNGGKYLGGNDGIVGGGVTGTLALITLNSGWTIDAVYHPVGGNTHIAGGVFQANNDNQYFKPIRFDELIYVMQLGWKPELRGGKGRYSIFSWHVDETDNTTAANGFALNAEQEFGKWTPFFRYSFGDQDRSDPKSHPIRQSANIGIGYDQPFGRSKDWIALVGIWAEPTDKALRDQYGMEVDYKFRLTPHVFMTPHLQWINSPSNNPDKDNIWVAGLRAKFEF